ncbi:MAG: hypothetical protein ABIU09_01145 [Pyrinomonadaceae bacterium]
MDYVSAIATSILARPGCIPVLGPEIYTAIAEWEKKEIPLPVVLISIDEICGGSEVNAAMRSIDQLQIVVKKNFRIWLASDIVNMYAA